MPRAEPPGEIDARFDTEGVSDLEARLVPLDEVGALVLLDPDAVTDPVDERRAESGAGDDPPTDTVHLATGQPRRDGRDGGSLGRVRRRRRDHASRTRVPR